MLRIVCEKTCKTHYVRELWIDDIKVIACILVALGHFFQSMVQVGILEDNGLYGWFNQTIYYFHVPLFFICSGYLYQRFSKVENFKSWLENVLNKLLVLGLPYFIFSFITWALKTMFSGEVNTQSGSIVEIFFLRPTSPYWYLYCLFFIYVVTPTFYKKEMTILVGIMAVCLKGLSICRVGGYNIYAVSCVLENEVWFVLGMVLSVANYQEVIQRYYKKYMRIIGTLAGIIFLILSIWTYIEGVYFAIIDFLYGVLACISIITIVSFYLKDKKQNVIFQFMSRYTLPIFLMHTIFAASVRIVLLKIGIEIAVIHMFLGIGISFIGPILAAMIMKKICWMNFLLYPGKYIKIKVI